MDAPTSVRSEGMLYFTNRISDDLRQRFVLNDLITCVLILFLLAQGLMHCSRRDQLFNLTLDDIRQVANRYLLENDNKATSTVLGGTNVNPPQSGWNVMEMNQLS